MLSSASIQKLERYATTGLSRCKGSTALKNASEADSMPINLHPFIKGSYSKSDGQSQEEQQPNNNNNKNSKSNVQDGNIKSSASVSNSASNILVLLSEELWTEVANIGNSRGDVGANGGTKSGEEFQQKCYSDLFILSVGFSIGMIQYELEHLNVETVNNSKYRKLLECHLKCIKRLGRHNTIDGVSHTTVLATLFNVTTDLTLLLLSRQPNSVYSMNVEDHKLILPIVLDLLVTTAAQLQRGSAAHPLKKLINPKLISSQIRETVNSRQSHIKLSLFQKMGQIVWHIKRCRYSYIEEDSKAAVCNSILSIMTTYLSNISARYFVYFRGETDDEKMSMVGCRQSDVPHQVAPLAFAITPPVGPEVMDHLYSDNPSTRIHIWELLDSWATSIPLIFSAFCEDSSWASFAAEQRRKILGRQALEKMKENRKNLKDQEKDIQHNIKFKAMAALLKAREEEAKAAVNPYRNTGEGDDRDDATSSVGQTVSGISQAESDVRSVMSAASFASYSTFLSVVNSEALEREHRHMHESSDGNTNLPLILLEMCAFSIFQTVEGVKKAALAAVLKEDEKTTVTRGNNVMNGQVSNSTIGMSNSPDNRWISLLPLNAMDSTVAFIDKCWAAVAGMFQTLSSHMSRQSLTGVIIFALPEDVQYNFGLGYQSLGLVFARLVVPALLHEGEGTAAIVDPSENRDNINNGESIQMEKQHEFTKGLSKIISRIEARYVASTLEVYETVAPQVINQNLGAVLDACCTSSTSNRCPDNILSKEHKKGVEMTSGVGVCAAMDTEMEEQLQQQEQEYYALLSRIVERLGQSNQLSIVTSAILASCRKVPTDTQITDDNTTVSQTEKFQEIQNNEARRRQTTISLAAAQVLLRSRQFRVVFSEAVNKTVDLEGLLTCVVEQVQKVMFPESAAGVPDDETVEETSNTAVNDITKHNSSEPPMDIRYDTIVILMHLCSLVAQGSNPTTTVAFTIMEKLTELDGLIVHGLASAVAPLLRKDIPPIGEGTNTLHHILYESMHSRKDLRRLFALMCEVLVRVRQALWRAISDLGVDMLEEVIELIEESVWKCTSAPVDDESGSSLKGVPIIGGVANEITTATINDYVSSTTRTPFTDFAPSSVFCKLAVQRLHLTTSVAILLNRQGNVKKIQEALLQYIFLQLEEQKENDHSSQYITNVASSQECRTMLLLNSEEWICLSETLSNINDHLLEGDEKNSLPSVVFNVNCNREQDLTLSDTITSIPAFLQLSMSTSCKHKRSTQTLGSNDDDSNDKIIYDIIQQRPLWRTTGVVPNWLEVAGLLATSAVNQTTTRYDGCSPIAALEALVDVLYLVPPAELLEKVMSVQLRAGDGKESENKYLFARSIASEEWLRALVLVGTINSNNEENENATNNNIVSPLVRKLVELLYVSAVSVRSVKTLNAGHQFVANILTLSVEGVKEGRMMKIEKIENAGASCLLLLQTLLAPQLDFYTSSGKLINEKNEERSHTNEDNNDDIQTAIKYLLPKPSKAGSMLVEETLEDSASDPSRLSNIAIKLVKVLLKSVMSADHVTDNLCDSGQFLTHSSLLWLLLTTYLPRHFDAHSLFKIVYKSVTKHAETIKGVVSTISKLTCDDSDLVRIVCWLNICAMSLQYCCCTGQQEGEGGSVNEMDQAPDAIVFLAHRLTDTLLHMPYEKVHMYMISHRQSQQHIILPVNMLLAVPKHSSYMINKKTPKTLATPLELLQSLSHASYTFVEDKCLQSLITKAAKEIVISKSMTSASAGHECIYGLMTATKLLLSINRAHNITLSNASNIKTTTADMSISPVNVIGGLSHTYFKKATVGLLFTTSSICSSKVVSDINDDHYHHIRHLKRIADLIENVLSLAKTPLNTYYNCPAFVDSVFTLYNSVLSWCDTQLTDGVIHDVLRAGACGSLSDTSAVLMALYTTTMSSLIKNVSFLVWHHPTVISKRAPILPLFMRALFQTLLKGLKAHEDVVYVRDNVGIRHRQTPEDSVTGAECTIKDPTMLVGLFTATFHNIIKVIEGEHTVSSCTSAISVNPTVGPKSFIAFSITSALLSSINTRQLALFARYSDVLDLFGREMVTDMMKGRLPTSLQRKLVYVTANRVRDNDDDEDANPRQSDHIPKTSYKKRRMEMSYLSSYGLSQHLHYSDLCFAAIPQPENQALLRQYIMSAKDDGMDDRHIFNPSQ